MQTSPTTKDIFHVAGDVPDPSGTGMRGVAPGYRFTQTALGHPMLHYRLSTGEEIILEADVYALPEQPMYVHLICPRCLAAGRQVGLKIDQSQKGMSYDPRAAVAPFPGWTREQMAHALPGGTGGALSIEPFACTWEEAPELRRGFGLGRCGWRVAIDNNVVRDA